jgi:hypothetical protein
LARPQIVRSLFATAFSPLVVLERRPAHSENSNVRETAEKNKSGSAGKRSPMQ